MSKRQSGIVIQRKYAEPSDLQAAQRVAGFLAKAVREQLPYKPTSRNGATISSILSNKKVGS